MVSGSGTLPSLPFIQDRDLAWRMVGEAWRITRLKYTVEALPGMDGDRPLSLRVVGEESISDPRPKTKDTELHTMLRAASAVMKEPSTSKKSRAPAAKGVRRLRRKTRAADQVDETVCISSSDEQACAGDEESDGSSFGFATQAADGADPDEVAAALFGDDSEPGEDQAPRSQ